MTLICSKCTFTVSYKPYILICGMTERIIICNMCNHITSILYIHNVNYKLGSVIRFFTNLQNAIERLNHKCTNCNSKDIKNWDFNCPLCKKKMNG